MAANTTPIFTLTPVLGMVAVSTANTNHDGSGTLGSVITGGTNGTRLDRITVMAAGTTTAGMFRFYIDDGSSNIRAWAEIPVAAATPSSSVQAFRSAITTPDPQNPLLVLPSGYILKCAPHNAETFHVIAHGGNF